MLTFEEEIHKALEVLNLPPLITKADIKRQYHHEAKKHHPDIGGDALKMEEISRAYKLLMSYIDNFRYTFNHEEINRVFPELGHNDKFKL
ncbi:MAG: heat-shock protein [Sulfurovum sp. AS07-7]|jgi:DnaJ-class molecular chaperone|nr:MAG: heat-shock protein [Sulfurovum sp. AS07-7]